MSPARTVQVVLLASVLASAARAGDPCAPAWEAGFGTAFGPVAPTGPVYASAVFDAGDGPKLYIAGDFERLGNALCRDIAVWDDGAWRAVGGSYSATHNASGSDGQAIRALEVHDDGSGPALYAGGHVRTTPLGGTLHHLARWDGSHWSVPGGGVTGFVRDLVVHDDGSGPALYVAGVTQAGGAPVAGIARWDGASWTGVGAGIGPASSILCLASYDAGSGPELFAGGTFTLAGGAPGDLIARFDGTSWTGVGSGLAGDPAPRVSVLRVHDDGSGAKLFAGGYFQQAGPLTVGSIAAWNGSAWSAAGSGFQGEVYALEEFDGGGGARLHAGGYLFAGPEWGLYQWNGTAWSGVGGGILPSGSIWTLCPFDDGSGPKLFVGGDYNGTAGVAHPRATTWDGASWGTLGLGTAGHGLSNDEVSQLRAIDDGAGPALYALGNFSGGLRRWTGSGWTTPGGGISPLFGAAFDAVGFDDGEGPALFVAGVFGSAGTIAAKNVARWDGSEWSSLDLGLWLQQGDGSAYSLAVHDDGSGSALYVGGRFEVGGDSGVALRHVARWDGTAWSDVGGGLDAGYPWIQALCVFDDGSGPALYAAGGREPGYAFEGIARWDGSSWTSVGGGLAPGGRIDALCAYDDGAGAKLYAGGSFEQIGGVAADAIARWDGNAWTALPGTLVSHFSFTGPHVDALRVFDDGSGAELFVGGSFRAPEGVGAINLARFDGTTWRDAGGAGVQGVVLGIEAFDDDADHRADLFVAGTFAIANGFLADNVTAWRTCRELVTSFCFGDGTGASCPCGNDGLPGHGCRNSATVRGAELTASGFTYPDALVLRSEFEPATALSIFLQGSIELASPAPFGDGVRCIGGSLKRLYVRNAAGGIVSAPGPGDPAITLRSAALGDPIQPGTTRHYQVWYRDPDPSFCPAPAGDTFNISNGLSVAW